jgi:hypothetical protein
MNRVTLPRAQRGVTLVIGLIMLVLITLIVTGAFMLSGNNLRSVGNMQYRDEAVAAGNSAIEQVISTTNFTTAPPAPPPIQVDINHDGTPDFQVAVAAPACIRAVKFPTAGGSGTGSSVTLGLGGALDYYNTLWDLNANVTDAAGIASTGATVRVRQGVRVKLSQPQCDAACPPAPGTPCS